MVDAMDAVGRWPAVAQLRAWERDQLRLRDGATLLDVGCGTGEAGIALVSAAGPAARLCGLDASEVMLSTARVRAADAGVTADLRLGDARDLPYESGSVDAVRSERTLQWIEDPDAALAENLRVLKTGGRMVLIDTNWDSFTIDRVDRDDLETLAAAMRGYRGTGYPWDSSCSTGAVILSSATSPAPRPRTWSRSSIRAIRSRTAVCRRCGWRPAGWSPPDAWTARRPSGCWPSSTTSVAATGC